MKRSDNTGKIKDHSTEDNPLAKVRVRHKSSYGLKECPPARGYLEAIAEDAIIIAQYKDDIIRHDQIAVYLGVPITSFETWIDAYPDIFQKPMAEVDALISIRRETGSCIKDMKYRTTPFTPDMLRMMRRYDKGWKAVEKERTAESKALPNAEGNFTIEIPTTEYLATKELELLEQEKK